MICDTHMKEERKVKPFVLNQLFVVYIGSGISVVSLHLKTKFCNSYC